MSYDPTYYKIFKIKTKIRYTPDVIVYPKHKASFQKDWKKFYRPKKNTAGKTRQKQFQAFFDRLKKVGNEEKYCERISIRFISPKVGYGVFAKVNIAPYSILNHYTGVLKKDASIGFSSKSTFSFPEFPKYSIDGQKVGNWCRFMNHANKGNVVPWEYYLPEGPRIIFTASSKGIKKGEQLCYSYGDDYWDEEDKVVTL